MPPSGGPEVGSIISLCPRRAEFVIHLLIGTPGLDRRETERFVDFQNAIHTRAGVGDNVSAQNGTSKALSPVLAGAEGVERYPMFVREANDGLDFRGRGGIHDAGRTAVSARKQVAAIPLARLF